MSHAGRNRVGRPALHIPHKTGAFPVRPTTREACYQLIENALNELLEELGMEADAITPETMLSADLGISSIDAMHLMVLLEDALDQPMNFQDLAFREGEYMTDISMRDLLDFVAEALGIPESGSTPA